LSLLHRSQIHPALVRTRDLNPFLLVVLVLIGVRVLLAFVEDQLRVYTSDRILNYPTISECNSNDYRISMQDKAAEGCGTIDVYMVMQLLPLPLEKILDISRNEHLYQSTAVSSETLATPVTHPKKSLSCLDGVDLTPSVSEDDEAAERLSRGKFHSPHRVSQ